MFPSCYYCKKNCVTADKSEKNITNILTNEPQEILKKAATLKNKCYASSNWRCLFNCHWI